MRRTSFVRKGGAAASDLGTRPGLHGQTLVSSGHAELDKILGGGLPLGSLLLVLEDGNSRHHATLLRYFLAEGAACGQALALAAAAEPSGGLAQFVPQQLKRGSNAAKEQQEEDEKEGQEQYTLRIAWQYRRYLKPAPQRAQHASGPALRDAAPASPAAGSPRSAPDAATDAGVAEGGAGRRVRIAAPEAGGAGPGRPKEWCHQFDLSRGLGEEGLAQCRAAFLDCRGALPTAQLLSGAASFVQSLEQPHASPAGPAAAAAAQQLSASAALPTAPAGANAADSSGGAVAPAAVGHERPPSPRAAHSQQHAARQQDEAQLQPSGDGREPSGEPHTITPRTGLPPLVSAPLKAAHQVGRLAVLSLGSPDWWPVAETCGCWSTAAFNQGASASAALGHGNRPSTQAAAQQPAPPQQLEGRGPGEDESLGREVLRALLRLKAAVRERRCAAVVTVPAALHSAHSVARMAHLADAVLALESVADDADIVRLAPDSASVAGLLHVRKLPSLGALAPSTPEVLLFLVRNKRRRLSITPVEIDPDAEAGLAAGAAATGTGGGGSAASMLCARPSGGASSVLDF